MKPELSVVIPQYNELENLKGGVLDDVISFLQGKDYSYEVIVSDDGSIDGSLDYVNDRYVIDGDVNLLNNRHGGKAYALLKGIEASRGEYVLTTDMDQSTPLKEVEKLLPHIGEYDIVIGSRGAKRDQSSPFRKLASFLFSNFRRLILLRDIKDTQCGFKLFKCGVAKELFPKLDAVQIDDEVTEWRVSAFDVELLFMAKRFGYTIKEVEVSWSDEDQSNTKKRKFVKESVDMLKELLTVRLNGFKGKYKR